MTSAWRDSSTQTDFAATIIKTIIVDPTAEGMGLLAIMVAIRTLLGWATVLEIDGRWPWQREPPHPS